MFENIIGQKAVLSSLTRSLAEKSLPHALLFSGPLYSGKLSTALELGRVLSCQSRGAKWSCECDACRRHRLLIHPDMLLLGMRSFEAELQASFNTMVVSGQDSGRYLFVRSVMKILMRFNPVLWEGEAEKARQFQPVIDAIQESLGPFLGDGDVSPKRRAPAKENAADNGKSLKNDFTDIYKACLKLLSFFKSENIPVAQIRKAVYWAHFSGTDANKVIIIENADKMQSSSSNSLLKILEEPPANVYLILLTTRQGAILKTLRSRLRPYLFRERSREDSRTVLSKIFKEESAAYGSLRDYFLAWKDVNTTVLQSLTKKFLEHILNEDAETDILKEMKELFDADTVKETFTAFFEELYREFRLLLPGIAAGNIQIHHVEEWVRMSKRALSDIESLNITPKSVLENLYYGMRKVLWQRS